MKSMKIRTKEYNASHYLKTPKEIFAYLNVVLENDDPKFFMLALRNVGLNRENLYKTLSGKRNPGVETINSMLLTYGLRLSVTVN